MSERRKRRLETQVSTSQSTQPARDDAYVIDLADLFYRLLTNWKLIICSALILAIFAGAYTVFLVTPMYEATSSIYVLNRSDSAINYSDLQLGTALTPDYIKVFKLWEVHEEVISNLNLSYTYENMEDMLTISNEQSTRMIDITITSPDAEEGAAIANEYAKVASQYIADTMATDKPNIMSVALVPTHPVSPNKKMNVLLGFMMGAMLACAYVTVISVVDDKYKTADDIRKYTGLATIAIVPIEEETDSKKSSRRQS
ncbi:MAG: hypothetical protein E7321_02580 [Clostridiales bacterium]|nr:hypothetical protein [Clostridiales bacterium]